MHQSLGPGEQASCSWGNSGNQRIFGKRKGVGAGPKKRRRATKTALAPLLLSNLVSLRPRPLAEVLTHSLSGSHPTSHSSKSSSLMQKCSPPSFWAQVLQNQRPSLKTSSCGLITRVPLQSIKTSSKLSWVENPIPTPPPHQPSLSLQFSSGLQETGLTSSPR